MKNIRVGAAALNQTPLDWNNNLNNITGAIDEAILAGVSVLCLPELCITGYGCEDAFFYKDIQETALRCLEFVIQASGNIIVSVGLPLVHNGALYNVAALVADKKLLGFVPKQHLAADGVHYEPRWFKRWPSHCVDVTIARELKDTVGDIIFNVGGARIGFEICEDAWVADRPGADLAKRGVDIILNPSASHFAFGKHEIREGFVKEGSRAFRCVYIYSNLLGNESGRLIFDGDTLIASGGNMLAEGPRLTFKNRSLIYTDVDVDKNRTSQIQNGAFRPSFDGKQEVKTSFLFDRTEPMASTKESCFFGLSTSVETDEYDEFAYAVSLGLFDYMRKSHSKGFVVSLSGGADSAAVACLVRIMCDIGITELGHDEFVTKLGLPISLHDGCDAEVDMPNIMNKILTCVYQATANSSKETEQAARQLANGIGANFMSINVDNIVQEYIKVGTEFAHRALDWDHDDVALQNIQARVRGPSVWMIANIANALLLSTSNRSEAAVGYATMDGDTCGGLAPIAGIDKTFLRRWLVRANSWETTQTQSPLKHALQLVIEQQPTAELRPANKAQTDETDLMPYEILNFIEAAAIRDKQGPVEVMALLKKRFTTTDPDKLFEYLQRFFKLWSQNQWKRERYAIAFHLDDRNLDPKTWCRFPVLSGGFELELKMALAAHLSQTKREA